MEWDPLFLWRNFVEALIDSVSFMLKKIFFSSIALAHLLKEKKTKKRGLVARPLDKRPLLDPCGFPRSTLGSTEAKKRGMETEGMQAANIPTNWVVP